MRACKSLGIAVCVIMATTSPVLAAQWVDCGITRTFTPEQYWSWEGYLGVIDIKKSGDEIWGRLKNDPHICFRVKADTLNDPTARTLGYKDAIEEWFNRIPIAEERWNDPDVMRAREALTRLTGRRFERRTDLKIWWRENSDYLFFSEREGHLTADTKAKQAELPIAETASWIVAETYWLLEGRDWIEESFDRGDVLVLRAWIPPEGEQIVRVDKSGLNDRAAKERGYRSAVQQLIFDGVALEGPSGSENLVSRLESLTGESFSTGTEWVEWWKRNTDKLVLSPDGSRLGVRAEVQ